VLDLCFASLVVPFNSVDFIGNISSLSFSHMYVLCYNAFIFELDPANLDDSFFFVRNNSLHAICTGSDFPLLFCIIDDYFRIFMHASIVTIYSEVAEL
jgi:hypothetical protein